MQSEAPLRLTPRSLCGRNWPHGPFELDGLDGDHVAAAAAAQFAATVIAGRGRFGWTRAALASAAHVSANTVGRIESGDTWADLRSMGRICAALGVPLTVRAQRPTDPGGEPAPAPKETADPSTWLNLGALPTSVLRPAQVIDALLWHDPALRAEVRHYGEARQAHARSHASGRR